MENSLLIHFDCSDILDKATTDIFKRVAGFDVIHIKKQPLDTNTPFSLAVTTQGDYCLSIVMHTSKKVLYKMTEYMKHGVTPKSSDISVYTSEFFNILCGHIISGINRKYHYSAHFSVPNVENGYYITTQKVQLRDSYFYECSQGIIKIETLLY